MAGRCGGGRSLRNLIRITKVNKPGEKYLGNLQFLVNIPAGVDNENVIRSGDRATGTNGDGPWRSAIVTADGKTMQCLNTESRCRPLSGRYQVSFDQAALRCRNRSADARKARVSKSTCWNWPEQLSAWEKKIVHHLKKESRERPLYPRLTMKFR